MSRAPALAHPPLAAPDVAPAPGAAAAVAYQRKVLGEHEWKTLNVLSDLIIPADERSGSATEAGVPEFIDDWLDFKGGQLSAEIRGGLPWLEMECNRKFSHDFVGCSAAEQRQVLDRIAYPVVSKYEPVAELIHEASNRS
jgi:gluconate 2-dehydrogenase gamma chain